VGTELVVDIWYSQPGTKSPMLEDDAKYGPDTVQLLYSAGKTMAAYGYACAVTKGLCSYDQLVCEKWPEFATVDPENKGKLTVKEVL